MSTEMRKHNEGRHADEDKTRETDRQTDRPSEGHVYIHLVEYCYLVFVVYFRRLVITADGDARGHFLVGPLGLRPPQAVSSNNRFLQLLLSFIHPSINSSANP